MANETTLRTLLAMALCSGSLVALQDDAFYPGADLPEPDTSSPLTQGLSPGDARPDVEAAPFKTGTAPPSAAGAGFDAGHLTPTPDVAVRDLNGDGLLDLTHLEGGVTVWFGQGQGRVGPPVFVPTSIPFAMGEWGDANGDGRLDAVFIPASVLQGDLVETLLDQGDGSFVSAGVGTYTGGFSSWAVGDVTGDGFADIVSQDGSIASGTDVKVFPGLGDGHFAGPQHVASFSGFQGNGMALGDLDGDGLVDIATENHGGALPNDLRLFRQLPGGGWTTSGSADLTAFQSARLEIRDMTGDGLTDVIVHEYEYASGGVYTVSIYAGFGDGSVSSTAMVLPGAGFDALFADMNGDGLVDILSMSDGPLFGVTTVLARPDGTLAPPVLTGHRADPIGTADLDGDGVLDLFSARVVLFGRGDGSFDAPRGFALGVTPERQRQIAVADFDQDGLPDVAALNDAWPGLTVSMSDLAATWDVLDMHMTTRGLAVAAGDLDTDGNADVLALRATDSFLQYWLGRGDGTFAPTVLLGPSFFDGGNSDVAIGQFNGTPWADVAATGGGMLRRKLGLAELSFGPLKETPLPPGSGTPWLIAHDLDLDGLDDILVIQPEVHVFRCIGHGDFAPAVLVDGSATHVRLTDINGDGFDDLITSDGQEVRLRLADGQAGFGVTPVATLISDRDVLGVDLADVDGDGLLDIALGQEDRWVLHLGLAGGGFAPEPVDRFDSRGKSHLLRFVEVADDQRPDLLVVGQGGLGVGLSLYPHRGGPWDNQGFALAGAGGHPFLWGTGSLLGGSTLGLQLRDGAPGAPHHMIVGLTSADVPFKGGVLVPAPLLIISGLQLDAQGQSSLTSAWPPGTPPGVELWFQSWIEDAGGPLGLAASNAVRATQP